MKTRGIKDLYLPKWAARHAKILLFSFLFILVLSLIRDKEIHLNTNFLLRLGTVLLQVEIAIWLAFNIFNDRKEQYKDRKYIQHTIIKLLLFYLAMMVMAVVVLIGAVSISFLVNGKDFYELYDHLISYEMEGFLVLVAIVFMIGIIFFFFVQWLEAIRRERKLREEKLVFRYETLKNQVNPHFLFNSLNTLSSLVRTDPSLAEEFITKFSSIYRYVLENREADLIPLEDELDFARDYFFLQRIRDEGKISLDVRVADAERYRILPISLQILIENALKHNAATRDRPLDLVIETTDDDGIVVRHDLRKKTNIGFSAGTGLKNLGERAKLVTGREVEVSEEAGQFSVKVPLVRVDGHDGTEAGGHEDGTVSGVDDGSTGPDETGQD